MSALLEVREFLVNIQRKIGNEIDCVIEGRDIGSVVFPNADFKFFLTADLNIRSMRRKNELKKLGEDLSIDEIKASMRKRDRIDSSREFSPLKRSEDSIEIDSTDLTIDEQIEKIIKIIKIIKKEHQSMFENKNEENVVEQTLESEKNTVSGSALKIRQLFQLIILRKLRII